MLQNKLFTSKTTIQNENEDHQSENRPHTCQYCDKSFKWIYELRHHLKKDHYRPIMVCKLCEKDVMTKSAMDQHLDNAHFRKKLQNLVIKEANSDW